MKLRSALLVILLSLLYDGKALSQLSVNIVSANAGTIRTLLPNDSRFSNYQFALYPELQIGGDFLTTYFGWTLYWGVWDDGIKQAIPIADMVTYSYSSHIVGARLGFLPAKIARQWFIPVGVFAGFAHHFIAADYVGGRGYDGMSGEDFRRSSNTVEIGLNAQIRVVGPLYVRGELEQFIPLGNNYFDQRQENRRAYKVGIAVSF